MLYAIVALLAVIVDQWVKYWVAGNIPLESAANELIPGVISMVNVHNSGAAFGFLSGGGARIPFIIICGVFTVAIIIALATNFISTPLGRWSAVFVMAGGIGNCIDRILYGYVQDMFMFEFAPSFPIFNVADIFITVFAVLFIISLFFGGKHRDDEDDYDDDEDDDYDDYEDEDDEEDEPVRRPSLFKRRRRDDYDEDEDDYEEPQPKKTAKPAKAAKSAPAPAPAPAKKSRKPKYEEEYEQYKASRAARGVQTPPPAAQRVTVDPADPFAEWERANAQVEARRQSDIAERTGQAPTAPVRPTYSQYGAAQRQSVQTPAPAPAPTPAKPVKQESAAEDEFSLDDILNEFK